MIQVCDIDYLVDVAKHKKILDVERIKADLIPAFAKVYDTQQRRIKYVDLKRDTLRVLHRASSVVPYYYPPLDQFNIDGGVIEQIGFGTLRRQHPESPIVVCVNYDPYKFGSKDLIRNTLEGIVASWMYPHNEMIGRFARKVRDFQKDIAKIRNDRNALLINPPSDNLTSQRTVDPEVLRSTWEMGIKESERILEWVG